MHTAKQMAKNSFFYTGALIGQKILSTLYFWFYSNHLQGGAADVGRLQFALSFVTLFFIVGDLGFYLVFLRESSRKREEANAYFNTLLAIKLPLMLLASGIILAVGYFYHQVNFTLIALGLVWILLDNFTMLLYAIPRSRENLFFESIGVIGAQIITVLIGVSSLILFGSVVYLLWALIIGTFFNAFFVLCIILLKYHFTVRIKIDKKIALMLIKSMPAFAVAGILVKALNSLDIILVQNLTAEYGAVGLYSIPIKLITALSLTLPTALMGALYPALSHLYGKSEESLRMVFQNALDYLLIVAVPISFGFLALGDEVISALWRNEYQASIAPAKVMLFALPFIFLAFPTGNLLNAIGKQRYTAVSRALGLSTMVAADMMLIKEYYLIGAAISIVATHAVILASDMFFLRDRITAIKGHIMAQAGKVFLSSGILYALLTALSQSVPWYFLAVLGGVLYFIVLFIVRGINVKFLKYIV